MIRSGRRSNVRFRLVAVLNRFFFQEAKDVVENEVSIRLLGKEERLDEFLPSLSLVRHLADDLNNDTAICRGLSINRVDEDLAVLETDRSNLAVDFLGVIDEQRDD